MKKTKKKFIIPICLVLVFIALVVIYLQYTHKIDLFPHQYKPPMKTKTVYVFGEPHTKTAYQFPMSKPEFAAIIGTVKPRNNKQQSITIYQSEDPKKTTIFERGFYADGFHGNMLTYSLSSDSASLSQNGSLGSIGCSNTNCVFSWSNFYTWDKKQQAFVLDNISHKDFFAELLARYQATDKQGCSIIGGDILKNQSDLSLTELYAKYPSLSWYCSKSQGILPANLIFFLQTEKASKEITAGENIGSNDIKNTSL